MAIDVRGMAPLLNVFDMPTSIAYYRDVLGFEIVGTDRNPVPNNDWVLLELNGVQLMLNTAYEADQRPPSPDAARIARLPHKGMSPQQLIASKPLGSARSFQLKRSRLRQSAAVGCANTNPAIANLMIMHAWIVDRSAQVEHLRRQPSDGVQNGIRCDDAIMLRGH